MNGYNYIFYSNQKDYNPSDVFQKFFLEKKINFYTIETGNYIFNKKKNLKFSIFFRNNKLKQKIVKSLGYNNFINIFLFNLHNLIFFFKNRNSIIKENCNNILIAQGIANLFISKIINFFLKKKLKIIYFNGDIIPENPQETNLYPQKKNSILNYLLFYMNFILRFIILKTTKTLYYNEKIYYWDKKKFGKIHSFSIIPFLFDTNIKKAKNIKKKRFEFVHLGNIERSNGIIETIKILNDLEKKGIKSRLTVISSKIKSFYKNNEIKKYKNKIDIRLFDFLEEKKLKNILRSATFGMALYFFKDKKRRSNVMNGKVYFYLKNNLPVITTNYCSFGNDIKLKKLGFCSNDHNMILNFITNLKLNELYKIRKNIINYMEINSYRNKIQGVLKSINYL